MNNQINLPANSANRTTVLVIILIVSLVVAGFFLFKYFSGKDQSSPEQITSQGPLVEVKQLAKTENPIGIPANLPIDAGTKILQNYESTSADGRVQSTKKLMVNLDAQTALAKYHKFFEEIGWKRNVTGPLESPLLYRSPLGNLMVVVNAGTTKDTSEVEINVVQTSSQVIK